MPIKQIGQSMVEANLINYQQLNELLEYQKKLDERVLLGKLTVELGLINEEEFAPFLASYFGVDYLNLKGHLTIQKEALNAVPEPLAKRFNILPLVKEDDNLTVAISDPLDLTTLENLGALTGCHIKPVVSPANQIRSGISAHYRGVFLEPGREGLTAGAISSKPARMDKGNNVPPASSLIKSFVEKAYKSGVKAVHIQSSQRRVEILFRVDRKLQKMASYPIVVYSSIVNFVKKAAKLDSSRSDIPQSGYFVFNADKLNMEVGVSILPTLSGERIVLEVPRRIGWADEEIWYRPV